MFRRIVILFTELPGLMRLGVLILSAGGAMDLLYHAAPAGWAVHLDQYIGMHALGAHVATLLGMVVTMLGLLVPRASVWITHVVDTASEGRSSIE